MLSWSLSTLLTASCVSQDQYWTGCGGTQGLTAVLSTLWSRSDHLPTRTTGTSLTFSQLHRKRLQVGEGKAGPPPSTLGLCYPCFSLHFLSPPHYREGLFFASQSRDTLIPMGHFQLEIFYDCSALAPHAVPFPVISSLLASECNYLFLPVPITLLSLTAEPEEQFPPF